MIRNGNEIVLKFVKKYALPDMIAERIATIIEGNRNFSIKHSGYKYSLGTGNDYWMDVEPKSEQDNGKYLEIIVAARYHTEESMKRLHDSLVFLLHIDEHNDYVMEAK